MPTGYTADVADGKVTDFRTFALRCARAFGATIMQRDDPANDPPKLREVSSYEIEAVARDEQRVAALAAMTDADAQREAAAEYAAAVKRNREYAEETRAKRARYEAMLAAARAWVPPTAEHEPMKKFMIEQLTESIKFDCHDDLWPEPTRKSGRAWLAEQRQHAHESLGRSIKRLQEERDRVDGANAWIGALYDSLSASVPA
jgi:hypothetical protein